MVTEKKYEVVDDATGEVVNIIVWDGVTPYDPGNGLSLRLITDDE